MKPINAEKNYNSKFNVVEYAKGKVKWRNYFHKYDDKIKLETGEELYRSYYLHSEEIIEYYNTHCNDKGKNTTAGYDGDIWLDTLVIDIDGADDNLEEAHQRTKEILRSIEMNYEVDLECIRVNFSGSKGFHIRIASELFGGFEPSHNLHLITKQIAETLANGLTMDVSVYKTTALMRVVNSFNAKSDLYAIPLTSNELFTLSIDEIKELAKQPRTIEYADVSEYGANENLIKLKHDLEILEYGDCVQDIKKNDEATENSSTARNKGKITLSEALEPKGTGERHDSLIVIYGHLMASKFTNQEINKIVRHWNKQNITPMDDSRLNEELKNMEKDYSDIVKDFWRIRRNKKSLKVSIEITKFIDFLKNQGFAKIQFGKAYDLIRVTDNIASLQNPQNIKDFVFKHVNRSIENPRHREKLTDLMYDRVNKYFGETLLETVDNIALEIQPDTINSSFLFYKNGILEIKKGETHSLIDYAALDKPIWETQIKKRNFNFITAKTQKSEFEQFMWNAASKNENRFSAICSAIGYLLHRYKNKSNAKAIILMDEKITDVPVGRTGKSMLGKAISYMRESVRIDGKNYEFDSKFTFQDVSPTTEILEFNDVTKNFDFEKLFSVITDDMQVKYKYKLPFPLPFEKSPKILVSTNYTILGHGDSYRDRLFEIEFSDHYNAYWKPIDEFGHLFFDEWNDEEWNRFDNFMVECLQLYLDEGLISYKTVNVEQKKLLMETSSEFLDFMKGGYVGSREYDKENLFYEFKKYLGYESDMFGNCPVKKNTFTKYLKTYAAFNQLQYIERNSNGKQIISIV